jgi:hypothetical protein
VFLRQLLRWLAPNEGANRDAGKALMRRRIEQAQAQVTEADATNGNSQ